MTVNQLGMYDLVITYCSKKGFLYVKLTNIFELFPSLILTGNGIYSTVHVLCEYQLYIDTTLIKHNHAK
jgi:hypothetical protein